jgi:hypothetical protein
MIFVYSLRRSGDWANYAVIGSGISSLHEENQSRFDKSGLRLESVEFDVFDGVPRWLAIFRSGDWALRLIGCNDCFYLIE